MSEFNKKSRKRNAVILSGMGMLNQVVSNLAAFIYRTVFIYWLSIEYLGINGLFSNIIQIFSLAELGIGSVIVFRLYKPIKEDDVEKTAAYMHFYQRFYQLMAILILIVGALVAPFLKYVIHDAEVPQDINIYVVYALYIIQSATSYLFAYRQTLLDADQKGYINTATQMVFTCTRYVLSIIVLYLTRNYTLVLAIGIIINLLGNIWIYAYVSHSYSDVFRSTSRLSRAEVFQIYKDTGAMLCHRIGSTVVTSTDNIVMSMYVGTVAVGIYSNYYMIIQIIQNVMNNLLGSFTASIGNHTLSVKSEERYNLFKRLRFVNMWISVFCTCSLYLLMNPFIQIVWGKNLVFQKEIVIILCANFFLTSSRIVNGAFSNATGMFVYDKARPLIEATSNLVISVLLAQRVGAAGVFLGTIISSGLTVWWREPFLLYKKVFERSSIPYFLTYAFWMVLIFVISIPLERVFEIMPVNFPFLIARFLICGFGINLFLVLLLFKHPGFAYFTGLVKGILRKKL